MTTLDQMIETSRDFDAQKDDYKSREWKPTFDPACNMMFTHALNDTRVAPHGLNRNAWIQFCQKMGAGAFGKGSNRQLPVDLIEAWKTVFPGELSGLLNRHLEAYRGGLLVRTYDTSVRAILSDQYAIVGNTELLETAQKGLQLMKADPARIQITRPVVGADDLHAKVTLVNVNTNPGSGDVRDNYGIGFYLSNDETGRGKVTVSPYIQRHSCQNSIVYTKDESGFSAAHRGSSGLLVDRLALAMGHALKFSENLLETFLNSRQVEIPDFGKMVMEFSAAQKWSVDMTSAILHGSEGQESLFGFVNGLTYAAHTETENDTEAVMIERLAGDVLMNPRQHFHKAAWLMNTYVAHAEL